MEQTDIDKKIAEIDAFLTENEKVMTTIALRRERWLIDRLKECREEQDRLRALMVKEGR